VYEQEITKAYFEGQNANTCEDCISRQYLLDNCVVDKVTMPYVPVSKIKNAPPVTPKHKTIHWIKINKKKVKNNDKRGND
jgi:hypothetical protein